MNIFVEQYRCIYRSLVLSTILKNCFSVKNMNNRSDIPITNIYNDQAVHNIHHIDKVFIKYIL